MNTLDALDAQTLRSDIPAFRPGDTLKVHVKVIEGSRSRIQVFQGVVIRRQGAGARETFTVRKVSFGVGVERTFPVHSPNIDRIELFTRGDVRRAKLYYLRELRGKAAKIKEKRETPVRVLTAAGRGCRSLVAWRSPSSPTTGGPASPVRSGRTRPAAASASARRVAGSAHAHFAAAPAGPSPRRSAPALVRSEPTSRRSRCLSGSRRRPAVPTAPRPTPPSRRRRVRGRRRHAAARRRLSARRRAYQAPPSSRPQDPALEKAPPAAAASGASCRS